MMSGTFYLRRHFLCGATACAIVVAGSPVWSDEIAVPVALQAQLLSQVASYQRGFGQSSNGVGRLLLVIRRGDADSERAAIQMQNAVKGLGRIGGLPSESVSVIYAGSDALVREIDRTHPAAVYLTPGLDGDIAAIRDALGNRSVLTVSAEPQNVERGAVLGFDLVASRPKLVINLGQARRQSLDFSAQLLRIARVIP